MDLEDIQMDLPLLLQMLMVLPTLVAAVEVEVKVHHHHRTLVEDLVDLASSLSLTQPNKYLKNSYEYSER